MAEKQSTKERLKEITAQIETGIREIFQSGNFEQYQNYLRTMSKFHRYSVNNQMLIHLQRPDATLVAGFNKWKNQFDRHVKKGEKGIVIIAPTPYKQKIEEEKLDHDTKLPMLDADGNVIMEEKEIKIPMFRPTTVFDVRQTDGKPLPERTEFPIAALTGDVENYDVFMEALRRTSPVPIRAENMSSDMDGYFSPDKQEIAYREGMSQTQTVCAVIHEIGHAKLHNYSVMQAEADNPKHKDRNTEEVEAESISYSVCAYFGIETGANSFGYIASWSKDKTLPELRASLDTISKTADSIITGVETHFSEICKERGIVIEAHGQDETANAEQPENEPASHPDVPLAARTVEETPAEKVPDVALPPDPTMSIAAMNAFGYTDADMLPLSKERALELMERDVTVYMLFEDNAEAMAFEPEDITMHTGIFGITREDWEAVRDTVPAMDDALIQQKREQTFLNAQTDSFAIFQLKRGDEQAALRFVNTAYLREHGLTAEKANYDLIYTGALPQGENIGEKLESLYLTFNQDERPKDFCGHSLSVSDIVAVKEAGVVSCHYLDSVGYRELPDFWKPENYLKNAEMQLEDDYGMIDGIINNGPRKVQAEKLQQEQKAEKRDDPHKRPSVIARLRAPLPCQDKNVRNNAERDI